MGRAFGKDLALNAVMRLRLRSPIFLTLYPTCLWRLPGQLPNSERRKFEADSQLPYVLLRQSNGSYTGYEMADATPYGVLKATPNVSESTDGLSSFWEA